MRSIKSTARNKGAFNTDITDAVWAIFAWVVLYKNQTEYSNESRSRGTVPPFLRDGYRKTVLGERRVSKEIGKESFQNEFEKNR